MQLTRVKSSFMLDSGNTATGTETLSGLPTIASKSCVEKNAGAGPSFTRATATTVPAT